ncbi:MAG: acyl carrier protein [Oscillospiraceae bacterium]
MEEKQIFEKLVDIIHETMPTTKEEVLTMDTVVNRDIGMDSMNFILVICKIEAAFEIHISDKRWMKLSTLGDLVRTVNESVEKTK